MNKTQTIVRDILRAKRVLAPMIVVVTLAGCSSVSMLYTFADYAIKDRADDFFYLDDAAEARLNENIQKMKDWHRKTMLPKYAGLLSDIAERAEQAEAGPWTRPAVDDIFRRFRGLLDETARGAAPYAAAALAAHTSPEKIDYFREASAEYINEEQDEETAPLDERIEEGVERRTKTFERFVGTLTDDQIEIVRGHVRGMTGNRALWLSHLKKRHQYLAQVLSANPDQALLADTVYRLSVRGYDLVDPAYEQISERRWNALAAMYFDILKSLSDEQKATLVATLKTYAADMRELSAGS